MRLAQATATVAVTWFIVTRAGLSLEDLRQLESGVFDVRPGLLLASCATLFAGYMSTALIWARIVRDLGGPRLPAHDAVRLFMIGNLGRYVPGKVWQIAALAALARQRGVPATTATAAASPGAGHRARCCDGDRPRGRLAVRGRRSMALGRAGVDPGRHHRRAVAPPVFDAVSRLWFRVAKADPPAVAVLSRRSPVDVAEYRELDRLCRLVLALRAWDSASSSAS